MGEQCSNTLQALDPMEVVMMMVVILIDSAESARALLADGAPTVGRGKTF